MSNDVKNPGPVREAIRDYYRDADLWLPPHSSHRIYRVQSVNPDGSLNFYRIRDRITDTETLRQHLLEHTPLNVYFSVSSWLNPTKTSHKTYKTAGDGRMHRDKNGFMYSDMVVDADHDDREEVFRMYDHLVSTRNLPPEDMYLVWSGGGWHINIEDWFRDRTTADPIEREKKAFKAMQRFTQDLIDAGFDFDYRIQEHHINSPSGDTRRVRKLPGTLTKYGNRAEIVPVNDLFSYEPTQVTDKIERVKTEMDLNTFKRLIGLGS